MLQVLPNSIFFRPNENWFDFISQPPYRYFKMVDVGAGLGDLTHQMRARDFKIDAIDINGRFGQHSFVEIGDAINKFYGSDHCCILARPCHSTAFLDEFVKKHSDIVTCILYVGLEKNLDIDLRDCSYDLLRENVGVDGEHVYQIYGLSNRCRKYVHEVQNGIDLGWWRVEGSNFVNDSGGLHSANFDNVINTKQVMYSIQIEPEWSEFDYNFEHIIDSGWCDPWGRVYKVGYARHDRFIQDCLRVSVEHAELMGFVKFYKYGNKPITVIRADGKDLNEQQLISLEKAVGDFEIIEVDYYKRRTY